MLEYGKCTAIIVVKKQCIANILAKFCGEILYI